MLRGSLASGAKFSNTLLGATEAQSCTESAQVECIRLLLIQSNIILILPAKVNYLTNNTHTMKSLHSYFKRTAEFGECLVEADEIRQIINGNPHSAREVAGLDQLLPLHAALDTFDSTPLEVVKVIIDAYPDAVSIPDVDGLLPLAYACDNGVDPKILHMLLNEYPGSIHYLNDEK